MSTNYWLMKSEPESFSIHDLKKSKTTEWDGVRNYQARNFMMNMKKGDLILFYHSNAKPPGIAGIAEIKRDAKPDITAFNPKSDYFDPKATKENPRWFCPKVGFKKIAKTFVSISDLKSNKKLKDLKTIQKGSRLSVHPVTKSEFIEIKKMMGIN